jgi:hypothetical protein
LSFYLPPGYTSPQKLCFHFVSLWKRVSFCGWKIHEIAEKLAEFSGSSCLVTIMYNHNHRVHKYKADPFKFKFPKLIFIVLYWMLEFFELIGDA